VTWAQNSCRVDHCRLPLAPGGESFASLCIASVVADPPPGEPWHLLSSQRRKSRVCWASPEAAFRPPQGDHGGISGCVEWLPVTLKRNNVRFAWKIPFLCSKEDNSYPRRQSWWLSNFESCCLRDTCCHCLCPSFHCWLAGSCSGEAGHLPTWLMLPIPTSGSSCS
jgi:hypothetical protein